MAKLKVGDIVRYTGNSVHFSQPERRGDEGTVEGIENDGLVAVRWDNHRPRPSHQVYPENIEVIAGRAPIQRRIATCSEIARQTLSTKDGCEIDVAPGVNLNEVVLDIDPVWAWTSASIREAATLFNELADVLDENAREAA